MNRHDAPNVPPPSGALDDEQLVARLFEAAGAPPPAPEIEIARIQEAARSEWRRRYAWRRRARLVLRWQVAAVAATVVAAVALFLTIWARPGGQGSAPAPAAVLATVERLAGEVLVAPAAGGEARPLGVGEAVVAGSVVRTADAAGRGSLALAWRGGRSLRLDAGTEVEIAAADRIALRRGAVYLDSRGGRDGDGPAITTVLGRFLEIGTQFEVRVLDGAAPGVRLRVREGAVAWSENGRSATAEAGIELSLAPDGEPRRERITPYGAAWSWVLAAAPTPAIEGWPLARFLAWYGRESGLVLVYADTESAELAATVVVHGSVTHLAAADALEAVLASSGFSARVEAGALIAAARRDAPR